MRYLNNVGGGTPHIMKFTAGATMSVGGVPVTVPSAGAGGLVLATTVAAVDLVGLMIDQPVTLVTAQQSDNSDPANEIAVVVSLCRYQARLSGGATAGTDLAEQTETAGSTTGLVVTTGAEWSSPTYDEGLVWGYKGANAGVKRKIASVSSTAGTVAIAFPHDIAVGDSFIRVPFAEPGNAFVQLTSDLTEVNAAVAVDTDNNNFRVQEVLARDLGGEGLRKSFVNLVPFDLMWAGGGSV